jgi:hypothetical protein
MDLNLPFDPRRTIYGYYNRPNLNIRSDGQEGRDNQNEVYLSNSDTFNQNFNRLALDTSDEVLNPKSPSKLPQSKRKISDSWSWIQRFDEPSESSFTVFNAILDYPDLVHYMVRWFAIDDLVSLYAISKDFHMAVNRQFTTTLLSAARTRSPESGQIFHFKCYRSLCMADAAQNLSEDRRNEVRDIPSLRWLRMVYFREETVDSILVELALKGLRLPRSGSLVLKKIWFLLDLPDSRRRIGIVHNPALWSNSDLYIASMFFLKLDMAYTDPVDGTGEYKLRKLLMAQRSLSTTAAVLRREEMRNQYELLQMHVRWTLDTQDLPGARSDRAARTVFGIPLAELGSLRGENWRPHGARLWRPDEIVLREAIRRDLRFRDKLYDMMLWGNLHPVTREDVWPRDQQGRVQVVFEDRVEDLVEEQIRVHASPLGTTFDWDEPLALSGPTLRVPP